MPRTPSVPFHVISQANLVAGALQLALRPDNLGTSLASISDGYELFRFRSFRFRIFAFTTAGNAGVVTSVPNSPPTTTLGIGELLDSVQHEAALETRWSKWVQVQISTLTGPFPWYHTRLGTFDPTEAAPATFCFAGTGTAAIAYEAYGVVQFKDVAPTAATPLALELRASLRKENKRNGENMLRARLLSLLQGGISEGRLGGTPTS